MKDQIYSDVRLVLNGRASGHDVTIDNAYQKVI